ncbi:MAG TPA: hypothetical protein PKA85_00295 [Ferruginibacter sp.]|nr:hypothetical protein [Ferruginibacter sp.]
MHSVCSITKGCKKIATLLVVVCSAFSAIAQENSPYSRYGIGDATINRHIINRGMGGISAGYQSWNSANLVNPAANYLSNRSSKVFNPFVLFDVGAEVNMRNLKSNIAPEKYRAINTTISYLHFGFPVTSTKMAAKNKFWAFNFGLKPITRIAYKIDNRNRLPGIDSAQTLYEGSGGLNQAYIGTAVRIKNLSLGFNMGYEFGNKTINNKRGFINDTLVYYIASYEEKTTFNGLSYTAGMQYDIPMKSGLLKLGAYGTFAHNLSANRNAVVKTVEIGFSGEEIPVDTVKISDNEKGDIKYPLTWGAGFTFQDKNEQWLFGIDYEQTRWSDFRVYDEVEPTQNTYMIRGGVQYYPAKKDVPITRYGKSIRYRLGFYYGTDAIRLTDEARKDYAVTFGAGLPLSSPKSVRSFSNIAVLNTSVEIGGRGNKNTGAIREGLMRFNVGVSFSGNWFQKRKYF